MNASNSEIRRASTVFLAALVLVSGCGRKEEAAPGPTAAKPPPVRPAMASVEKTSFQEVTSQLDPGGNLFAYFGTEQWIRGASEQVSSWRGILQVAPVLTDEQRAEANKGFDLATRLIRNSGLEEISGVGMSGIATEKGRYRTRLLVHHYPDRKSGYLWSLFGAAPHPLDGLNQLPATTALSVFFDFDLRALWSILQREMSQSGISGPKEWSTRFPRSEKGRYRTRLLVHHYPDRKSGYLWSLFGAAPHPLDGLNQLPATTALSVFFDFDLRALWSILQREMSQSGISGPKEWSTRFP